MGDSPDNSMSVTSGGSGQPASHAPTSMPSEIDNFMRQLTSDRLIKIYLGAGPEQKLFLVPQSALTAKSEYFKKAVQHEANMGTQDSGVLYFPEDGHLVAAWGVMLYWIIHHRLPFAKLGEDKLALYTEAWVLGDKHLLPEFQNLVMFALIEYFKDTSLPHDCPELVKHLLHISPADSTMRRLLAEETVFVIYSEDIDEDLRMDASKLGDIEGTTGVTVSLLNAFKALSADRLIFLRIGRKGHEDDYKTYLVEEGNEATESGEIKKE